MRINGENKMRFVYYIRIIVYTIKKTNIKSAYFKFNLLKVTFSKFQTP